MDDSGAGDFEATARTRLVREASRAVFDRAAVNAILDEGLVCHLGFVADGQPFVIPTLYARVGDHLYIHGSAASRTLRALEGGVPVCVTVTLIDGIVVARSIFNHSMNYRSVVVLGSAEPLHEPSEKLRALRAFSEQLLPGRWQDARAPNDRELKATAILRVALKEVSAKVRQGGPDDDEEDYGYPAWAGVVPLRTVAGPPIDDSKVSPKAAAPAYVKCYRRPAGAAEGEPG